MLDRTLSSHAGEVPNPNTQTSRSNHIYHTIHIIPLQHIIDARVSSGHSEAGSSNSFAFAKKPSLDPDTASNKNDTYLTRRSFGGGNDVFKKCGQNIYYT